MTESRYLKPAFILAVTVITFISFYPCLSNSFVNWDDPELLTNNQSVQHLSLQNIGRLFTRYYCGTYIPLTLMSFAAEHGRFKDNPMPYHALNIILHALNALLVLWLVSLLSKNSWVAFIAALIFAVHPLRIESVAWIAERKDVLFAFFYLLAIITYIYYTGRARLLLYFASLACFVLALFAKGVAATLPFVLLLFDYFQNRRGRVIIINKLPYLVLAVFFTVIAISAQKTLPGHSFPFLKNIFIMSYVVLFYIGKTILPIGLSPLYPFPMTIVSKMPWQFWLAPIIVIIIAVLVIVTSRRSKMIAFGCLFFLLTILPVLQFIPVAGPEIAANRYTYIPSIGLILIFAEAIAWIYRKISSSHAGSLKFLPAAAIVVIIALFVVTSMNRCRVWKNSITLWSDVIKKYPDFPHAYTMRAQAYADADNMKMAVADYTRALDINPGFSAALLGRGNLLLKIGDFSGAIADYFRILEIDQKLVDAYVNRGNAYSALGQFDPALDDYNHALVIDPFNNNAIYNRAVVYFLIGNNDKAWQDVRRLLEVGYPVKPEFLEALKKQHPDQHP
ncbi:MAG TPA: tetratricopeptide repeat protein [bacterium]